MSYREMLDQHLPSPLWKELHNMLFRDVGITRSMLRSPVPVKKDWENGTCTAWRRCDFLGGTYYSSPQYLQGDCQWDGTGLVTVLHGGRTRDNGFKLKEWRSRLDMKRNVFIWWTVKQWSRLPREAVHPQSFEVYKAQLNQALCSVVWPHSWPCWNRRLD